MGELLKYVRDLYPDDGIDDDIFSVIIIVPM